jgi:hypothetical protein
MKIAFDSYAIMIFFANNLVFADGSASLLKNVADVYSLEK